MANEETDFIARLFAQEIPEIAAGTIEIKAVARKLGCRSKLAVYSYNPRVDCIKACVGVRGAHIKKIVDILGGERIDLLRWQESPERFIANALQPAAILEVILYPAQHRAVVVVEADQVALVNGRRGENRELASRLCGWQIDVKEQGAA
jgi:N utilization substance protein A